MYNKLGKLDKKGGIIMVYIDNIKYLRKLWKYSQKDMAELLNTTQQQYSKYENKQQELPIRHLVTICNHFNVSADWILELEIEEKNDINT